MLTSREARCGIAAYSDALVRELQKLEVSVDLIPPPSQIADNARLASLPDELNRSDVVHVQHEYSFFGGIAPGKMLLPRLLSRIERPLIVTAHTVFTTAELLRLADEKRPRQRLAKWMLAHYPPYRRRVEAGPFERASAVIVHTADAGERIARWGIPRERISLLPAGIPELPQPDEATLNAMRERLGAGRRVTIFGYVNRDKGYETALAAIRSLPPQVRLIIAGGTRVEPEAPYMAQLLAEIKRLRLRDRVVITGYLTEIETAAVMTLSDVALAPHTSANGSYSVLIALAAGRPVLASDLPCFREIAATGSAALFDVGDETMLAERLGFLLASPGARAELQSQAEAYAAARTWRRVAERTRDLYLQVVGDRR